MGSKDLFTGILFDTAILGLLKMILVAPLTNLSISRELAAAGIIDENVENLPEDQKVHWQNIVAVHYILWMLSFWGFLV
jgi:hypothetical protein